MMKYHFTRIHRTLDGKTFFAHYSTDVEDDPTIPQNCHRCNIVADFLCDYPVENGRTCDMPLCSKHRTNVGFERDYCETHAMMTYVERQRDLKNKQRPDKEEQEAWMERYAGSLRPVVVNVKHPMAMECGFVYVGRMPKSRNLGRFGNPFYLGRKCQSCGKLHHDSDAGRKDLLACYKKHLWERIRKEPDFRRDIRDLASKNIGCHCAPLQCHADVLAEACVWLWSPQGVYSFPLHEEGSKV